MLVRFVIYLAKLRVAGPQTPPPPPPLDPPHTSLPFTLFGIVVISNHWCGKLFLYPCYALRNLCCDNQYIALFCQVLQRNQWNYHNVRSLRQNHFQKHSKLAVRNKPELRQLRYQNTRYVHILCGSVLLLLFILLFPPVNII